MKRKHAKTAAITLALATLVLLMAACGDRANNNPGAMPSAPATESAAPTASNDPQNNEEPKKGTGEYTGLQDNHTIEIKTENGYEAFQINSDTLNKLDDWESGTPVTYTYTEEPFEDDSGGGMQYTIVTIDIVE